MALVVGRGQDIQCPFCKLVSTLKVSDSKFPLLFIQYPSLQLISASATLIMFRYVARKACVD